MRFLLIAILMFVASQAHAVTQIVHGDITWTFDTDSTAGTFVNGDPWIVVPSGTIEITSTLPTPVSNCGSGANSDCHGVQKNPIASDHNYQNAKQGLDERAGYYSSGLNVGGASITITAGDAVIKVESYDTSNHATDSQCSSGGNFSCVESTSILTVLASSPAADAFRPPYLSGSDKTIRTKSEMDLTGWPDMALTAITSEPTQAAVNAQWGCSSLEHVWHIGARNLRGLDCVKNLDTSWADYDAELGNVVATTVMRTFHDDMTEAEKLTMLIPVVQFGLDLYEIQQVDTTNIHWAQWGGYGGGRKLPILVAGRILKDSAMYGIGTEFSGSPNSWGCGKYWAEDSGTYYGSGGVALYGSADQYWDANGNCGCTGTYGGGNPGYDANHSGSCDAGTDHCRDPDGLNDGDHPGKQPNVCGTEMRTPAAQIATPPYEASNYQWCCTSGTWIGEAVVALELGLKTLWNHDPFFDYTERYNGAPWSAACGNCEQYNLDMYAELYDTPPADWTASAPSLQGGSITGGSLSFLDWFLKGPLNPSLWNNASERD